MKEFAWCIALYTEVRRKTLTLLETFEMWIWRRLMKVSWTEDGTNEEVLQMVESEREITDTLRIRQKKWISHICRHDSLLKTILKTTCNVRRTNQEARGR